MEALTMRELNYRRVAHDLIDLTDRMQANGHRPRSVHYREPALRYSSYCRALAALGVAKTDTDVEVGVIMARRNVAKVHGERPEDRNSARIAYDDILASAVITELGWL